MTATRVGRINATRAAAQAAACVDNGVRFEAVILPAIGEHQLEGLDAGDPPDVAKLAAVSFAGRIAAMHMSGDPVPEVPTEADTGGTLDVAPHVDVEFPTEIVNAIWSGAAQLVRVGGPKVGEMADKLLADGRLTYDEASVIWWRKDA